MGRTLRRLAAGGMHGVSPCDAIDDDRMVQQRASIVST